MKIKTLLYILLTLFICFHNCEVYIADKEEEIFEIDENIIIIHNIMAVKRIYIDGEFFHTIGDRITVQYLDNTSGTISSGFTQEWAEPSDDGISFVDWFYDDSLWKPIKHDDMLPDIYSDAPHFPRVFYVRAVYNGLKGNPGSREIRPK